MGLFCGIILDMAPFLGPDTEPGIERGKNYKFVADKNKIAFEEVDRFSDTKPLHNVVANRHGLGTPLDFDPSGLIVDDAGYLEKQENGRLLYHRQSNSCLPRDKEHARTNTQKLSQELTGKEADIEEGIWW